MGGERCQPTRQVGRVFLLAVSAALYVLAFPTAGVWPLIFVALVPALVATAGLEPWPAFRYGLLLGFLISAAGLTWFFRIFGPGALSLWMILAAWVGVFFGGRAVFERNLPPWAALPAVVLWWTAAEFFRAECYPLRCSFLCLGHALAAPSSPFKLAARWLGAYGLGTLVMALNVALAHAVIWRGPSRRAAPFVAAGALAALVLITLGARSTLPRDQGLPVRVALVQGEPGWFDRHVTLSYRAEARKPHWVFWSELCVLADVKADPKKRERLARLAQHIKATVAVGARLKHPTEPDNFWNAYVLFGPAGDILGEYHKVQPVPLMKDGVAGDDYPVFETERGTLGVAICYDGDFTWIARRLVANGAEALAIPIYDPAPWGPRMREQHLAASVLRAIETGRYVVRPANAPPTVIIDPAGHISARRDDPGAGVLHGDVWARADRTLYGRLGWLLPYACQLVAGSALVWASYLRLRRRKTG